MHLAPQVLPLKWSRGAILALKINKTYLFFEHIHLQSYYLPFSWCLSKHVCTNIRDAVLPNSLLSDTSSLHAPYFYTLCFAYLHLEDYSHEWAVNPLCRLLSFGRKIPRQTMDQLSLLWAISICRRAKGSQWICPVVGSCKHLVLWQCSACDTGTGAGLGCVQITEIASLCFGPTQLQIWEQMDVNLCFLQT